MLKIFKNMAIYKSIKLIHKVDTFLGMPWNKNHQSDGMKTGFLIKVAFYFLLPIMFSLIYIK